MLILEPEFLKLFDSITCLAVLKVTFPLGVQEVNEGLQIFYYLLNLHHPSCLANNEWVKGNEYNKVLTSLVSKVGYCLIRKLGEKWWEMKDDNCRLYKELSLFILSQALAIALKVPIIIINVTFTNVYTNCPYQDYHMLWNIKLKYLKHE